MLAFEIFNGVNRSELVEFPFTHCQKYLTILQKPNLVDCTNILNVLAIFPISIWTLLIINYVIVCLLNKTKFFKISTFRFMLEYFGLSLGQFQKFGRNQFRILISTWLISTFFLIFIFKNDFLSRMVKVDLDLIHNLGELLTTNYSIFMPFMAGNLKPRSEVIYY